MEKHIIWSNHPEHLDYENWKEDLEYEYPELTENERIDLMYETNDDYLDDERLNLGNIQFDHPILIIADLGLWNGRKMGYKIIQSGRVEDCLYSDSDYVTWYVDERHNFRAKCDHHDGTNHLLYRILKDDEYTTSVQNLLEKIYQGTATQEEIMRKTTSIGKEIGKVYGW